MTFDCFSMHQGHRGDSWWRRCCSSVRDTQTMYNGVEFWLCPSLGPICLGQGQFSHEMTNQVCQKGVYKVGRKDISRESPAQHREKRSVTFVKCDQVKEFECASRLTIFVMNRPALGCRKNTILPVRKTHPETGKSARSRCGLHTPLASHFVDHQVAITQ